MSSLHSTSTTAFASNRFQQLKTDTLHSLVSTARGGVSTMLFYHFAKTINMPEKTLASLLNLSARTISNYKLQKKKLEPVYSEHLLKLVALFQKGEEIFGTIEQFNQWIQKPFWNRGDIPFNWLTTSGGIDLLTKEIDRLAEGYPV